MKQVDIIKLWIGDILEGEYIIKHSPVEFRVVQHAVDLLESKGELPSLQAISQTQNPLEAYEPEILVSVCINKLNSLGIDLSEEMINIFNVGYNYGSVLDTLLTATYRICSFFSLHSGELLNTVNPFGELTESFSKLSLLKLRYLEYKNDVRFSSNLEPLPVGYENDPRVKQLLNLINSSIDSLVITGKAGTGKSTFVRYVARKLNASVAIVSPTGISAIRIGGSTIHSFFRLDHRMFLPNDPGIIESENSHFKTILNALENLIIDEISMVRADLLQAIDITLRINRHKNQPFGGVRLILVGDLFQLPPVVNRRIQANAYLFEYIYPNIYFFDAPVFSMVNWQYIELPVVHRQTSQQFIDLLDTVRMGIMSTRTCEILNSRAIAPKQTRHDLYLTLAPVNWKVDQINEQKMQELDLPEYHFTASIRGDFPEDRFPTEHRLELRNNAQVMFVKNAEYWVNGSLGRITEISENKIKVLIDTGKEMYIEHMSWDHVLYTYDKKKKRIKSKVVGTFTQYPIKPAWAVTIHKSQGLTVNRIHIDFGTKLFAPGQGYVALSRCRTLEGITLTRELEPSDFFVDPHVVEFYMTKIWQSV